MINRAPFHLICRRQNHFQHDNVHLLQRRAEEIFTRWLKRMWRCIFLCAKFKSKHARCVIKNLHIIFSNHAVNCKNVKGGQITTERIPSRSSSSEAKCRRKKYKQPTAGDNIVSNYSHPYWAEDLSVVCFSVISGPVAHLIPACIGSVKHQWGGEALVDPGEERDEVIRTSEEIRLIYCYTLLMVWLSDL